MKKLLLGFILITGCTVNAQQKGTIVYDDNVEVRQVPNFTAIKVSSAIDLYLTQSNEIKVAVSASNDEIRGRVITEVQGGTLIIKLEENGTWFNWKKWGNYKIKAYVSVKDINAIIASGASDVHIINQIESPKIKIKLSGASDLDGEFLTTSLVYDLSGASHCKAKVQSNTISITTTGASEIELTGSVDDLSAVVSGASDAKLYNLAAKAAILNASGASNIKASVSEILKVNSNGASSIDYKGSPNVKESSSSGASNIRHRGQ
ncbi:MAG: head GIN domain-containing protein [Chitinophagia bacterium]|jgi:Putative auto-transporter adhesin, head GIN domain